MIVRSFVIDVTELFRIKLDCKLDETETEIETKCTVYYY